MPRLEVQSFYTTDREAYDKLLAGDPSPTVDLCEACSARWDGMALAPDEDTMFEWFADEVVPDWVDPGRWPPFPLQVTGDCAHPSYDDGDASGLREGGYTCRCCSKKLSQEVDG